MVMIYPHGLYIHGGEMVSTNDERIVLHTVRTRRKTGQTNLSAKPAPYALAA